ncbi:MAG: hypothetical protein WC374_01830 [Phycisphaerae bacterium]|jgi:hypothetical protein
METNNSKTSSSLNRLKAYLAAEKKKTALAAALIIFMIFLWIRVFNSKGPNAVKANPVTQQANANINNEKENKIEFIKLPRVEGRHDVLARDFFRMDGQFSGGARVVSTDSSTNGVREVAEGLRLDAISMGTQPEAFINDRLVKVGDVITVEGSKLYQCKVVSISESSVILKFEETEIELKLIRQSAD